MIRVESDVSGEWDSQGEWPLLADQAVRAAVAASRHHALADSGIAVEVSVKYGSDEEVRALNASYRGKDKPTNVLSFPMLDSALIGSLGSAAGGELLLGDVVLASGVCAREGSEKGVPTRSHAAHLIVHGALHLLGYDHETDEDRAEEMEAAERRALAELGIADPYLATEVRS
ncbi:rRNA maturation RNase YbeY [Allosphingosinicella sp.]|jgi:probable rRNA maturation factor|uniref:rRNA maturation RNase YbeY n=1 Tax=Allosphingosinicella sp. TaxID=2823234 RepID=UPI002F163756